ncbi:Integrase, catalytic core [Corchorus capsularis]|uniref:Integrase, catalytic core n=1 Tax=Corchorus capsularis TaxID=210143 RepID=A0A1R3FYF3_COCAP|nr:Integrase, catalytic core [Corchorus capsularis]
MHNATAEVVSEAEEVLVVADSIPRSNPGDEGFPILSSELPQQFATLSLVEKQDDAWYLDTGAASDMTSDLGELDTASPYHGLEKVMGKGIQRSDCRRTRLDDMYVLQPKHVNNLTSHAQAFFSNSFRVVSSSVLHMRLGHPQASVVQFLEKNKVIQSSNKSSMPKIYSSCQMGKACRLPFLPSSDFSNTPFEVIHCDLWGPSPVHSVQKNRHYVIFIDECTSFTRFFPLKFKSDFLCCFIKFHKFILTQFEQQIKVFQSDGGGEFDCTDFHAYVVDHGIYFQISCPGTHEQNGLVERKHRNITEFGLTMMIHAAVPKRFWVEAFSTALWLINRLPSKVLNMQSPFQKLFGKHPNYASLRVFGCLCFPYLRDYSNSKLDPKSLPYVFLGNSHQYKGYRCFCPSQNKVHIFRRVVFYEETFPFQQPGNLYRVTNNNLDLAVFNDWFPGSLPAPA